MRITPIAGLLLCSSLLIATDQLESSVLTAVKDATVYIKTSQGRGSGFLVASRGQTGWIVTNVHVIAASEIIEVVFDSGSSSERSLVARVASLDMSRDLAILQVNSEKLPRVLPVQGQTTVEETMPVWAVGFPFGDALAVGDAAPAPTISPTQVSSLRRDSFGNLEAIQTSGGINPGNSGGPVINNKGAVLAVSVAKVSGAEIGFGIPAWVLEDTLAGRVINSKITATVTAGNSLNVLVSAYCVDPLNNLSRITALVAPALKVTAPLKTDPKGRFIAPATTGMTEVALTYTDQTATGLAKIQMPKDAAKVVVVQFRYHRKDGSSFYTSTLKCGLNGLVSSDDAVRPPDSGTASIPRLNASEKEKHPPVVAFTNNRPVVIPVAPAAGVAISGRTEREGNGRSYTSVAATGVTLDLGKDVLQVAANATGSEIYVIHKDDPAIFVVDPETWKTMAEIPVPESPTSIWADAALIGVACGKSRVVALIDVKKRALVASGTLPELGKFTPETVVGRAPDGSVMSLWQLNGGAWWDRALVHTAEDGKTHIMINGEPLYWATWLPNGTGVVAQGDFTGSPSGSFDLAFPNGPKHFAELHGSKLLEEGSSFHTDSGPASLTADRKAVVWSRSRASKDRPSCAWTYLVSPDFGSILFDFPGSTILELPEQRLFVSLGVEEGVPTCYYVSNADGRVIRRITLQLPGSKSAGRRTSHSLNRFNPGAVYINGHELVLIPDEWPRRQTVTYTAYRCGPVANSVQEPVGGKPANDPPATAAVGDALTYTPKLEASATGFRLRRPLPSMSVDAKTGTWTWHPGKEHVGRWTVTILATIAGEETTVITWGIEVK